MIITREVVQQSQEAFDEYVEALAEDHMDIEVPMDAAEWVPKLIKLIDELKSENIKLYELDQAASDTINRWINGENVAEPTYYKIKNLSEENARLREALEFYADKNIYTAEWGSPKWIVLDEGNNARQALKGESE